MDYSSAARSNDRSARPKSTSRKGVRVVGKIRPFMESEKSSSSNISLIFTSTSEGDYASVILNDQENGHRNSYTLDCCYGQEESASNFFIHEVKPLLRGVLQGENSCVIAYGARGSGKTQLIQGSDEIPGMAMMTFCEISSIIKEVGGSVEISCYEIYNDHIYDLLDQKKLEVQVLEDAAKTIQLKGLSKIPVKSVLEFKKYYFQVSNQQKLQQNAIHDVRFRSHKGLIIYVTHVEKESNCLLVGKINLMDLAGYEDVKKKDDEKVYLSECAKVNKSLYALYRVVSALNGDDSYIPYRQMKLTRLLQGFLCSSNHAVLIACLSPRLCHDGIHAISLASRACQFVNRQRHDSARIKSNERRHFQSHNSPVNGLCPLDSRMMKRGTYGLGSSGKKISKNTIISDNRHQNQAHDSACKRPIASTYLPKWRKSFNISIPVTNAPQANSCSQEDATGLIASAAASALKGESAGSSAESVSGVVEEENSSLTGCEKSLTTEELQHISDLQECQLRIDNIDSFISVGGSSYAEGLYAEDVQQNIDPRLEVESEICSHRNSYSVRVGDNSSIFDGDKHSPTLTEQLREISNTLKALSSRPTSILTSKTDDSHAEPKTPGLPFSSKLDGQSMSESFTTPQEKFKQRSIGLKKSLVNECLDFLNSASKEELKQLKGIGEKRANWILQLREETPKPFQEIDDLKGLGLSSKQIKGMMSKVLDI